MRAIEIFDRGVLVNPAGRAFASPDGSESLTYRETAELTHRIAGAMRRDHLCPGDTVAVLSPNSLLMFPCMLGVFRAGCVWTQLNARSKAAELIDQLELVQCQGLLFAAELVDTARSIREAGLAQKAFVAIDGQVDGAAGFEEWLAPAGTTVELPPLEPEGLAMFTMTGGTTGSSKAAAIPHRALESMIDGFLAHMPEREPVYLVAAPISHAAGCVVYPVLAVGGTNVVHPAVDAEAILASIERNRVTRIFLPPTAIYSLLAHPRVREFDTSSLRYFLYAAAPMSVDKLEEALEVLGPVMAQCYGQAELPMLCTFLSPAEHADAVANPALRHRLKSCGRPSVIANVGIMNDRNELLGPGEKGEIVVRSSLAMRAYHQDEAETAAVERGNGWRGTGDVGYADEDGFVYVVDRSRDMIITGGFNVYPGEVEQVIWGIAAVKDCAVIGLPDERWGERVTAVIELKEEEQLDPGEVISICKAELGSIKAPKEVLFRQLPRSPVGKVLKRALREEYWTAMERRV